MPSNISVEGKIGIALGLIGLFGAGAAIIAPNLVPLGWGLISISILGCFGLALHHAVELWRERLAKGKLKLIAFVGMLVSAFVFLSFAAWYFWPKTRITATAIEQQQHAAKAPSVVAGTGSNLTSAQTRPAHLVASTKPLPLESKLARRPNESSDPGTPKARNAEQPPARVVIDGLRFRDLAKKPDTREVVLAVTNRGPGVAYAGVANLHIEFREGELNDGELSRFALAGFTEVLKENPPSDSIIESGEKTEFLLGEIPKASWDKLLAGQYKLYVWIHYAYTGSKAPQSKAFVSYLYGSYSDYEGGKLRFTWLAQDTEVRDVAK